MISYFRVFDHSMQPFCQEGDFVVTQTMSYPLQVGHVVVFKHPLEDVLLLKRIQWIKEDQGKLFYWVQGDNQRDSRDSRSFGWIEKESILGKAQVIHKTHSLVFGIL
jgi:signal peptidase I